ncbi:MG(2+) chelatase family protein / ComM-related protein [Hydrogenimonas sp.]|nr:MG(2+) chelatase family protein / ComM-related protein [Hydrogenimonas sp.]
MPEARYRSRKRVKSALLTNGFSFPARITVNLSPSDISKSGSHFDLAIALAIALQDEDAPTDGLYVSVSWGSTGR